MTLPFILKTRVDKKSSPHGCWLWTGRIHKGYGNVWYRGRGWRVHRLTWTLLRGPIPAGLNVLHNCPGGDNTRCCNPKHLWLGDHRQNVADRDAKGRTAKGDKQGLRLHPEARAYGIKNGHYTHPEATPRGADHGMAKITKEQVIEIRRLCRSTFPNYYPVKDIAKRFGISRRQVRNIALRRSWADV